MNTLLQYVIICALALFTGCVVLDHSIIQPVRGLITDTADRITFNAK